MGIIDKLKKFRKSEEKKKEEKSESLPTSAGDPSPSSRERRGLRMTESKKLAKEPVEKKEKSKAKTKGPSSRRSRAAGLRPSREPKEKAESFAVKETVKKEESKKKKKKKAATKGQAYKILIRPIVSEKATSYEAQGVYSFVVNRLANKVEIKQAIEQIYGVRPAKVRTLHFEGKKVRFGRIRGKRKDWKKAIVTLPKGKHIEIHEGV